MTNDLAAAAPASRSSAASLLDQLMPTWHYRERHRRRSAIPISTSTSMAAVRTLTWADVPAFHLIMKATGLGRVRFPAHHRVLDLLLDNGFAILAESSTELVIGGVEKLTSKAAIVELGAIPYQSFLKVDEPGLVKICTNFSCPPDQVATETRVYATDRRSRIAFGVYWTIIRAGSGLIRRVWLSGIESRARHIAQDDEQHDQQNGAAPRENGRRQ